MIMYDKFIWNDLNDYFIFEEGMLSLEFILLFSISLIPFFCGCIVLLGFKMPIARAFAYFLILLSLWQMDVAVLYGGPYLSEHTIEILFQLFRIGPVLIMPLLYYYAYYIYQNEYLKYSHEKKYRLIYNKVNLALSFIFSLGVYGMNLTNYGVNGVVEIQPYLSFPSHYVPLYGPFNIVFYINIILVFVHSFLILFIANRVEHARKKRFYRTVVFASLFMYVNGMLSGFLVLPLFLSVVNTFFTAIVLFVAYFNLQNTTIKLTNRELEEQRNFLEIILNLYPNHLYVKDRNNNLVSANAEFSDLFHSTPEELIGVNEREITKNIVSIDQSRQPKEVVLNLNDEIRTMEWDAIPISFKGRNDHTLCIGSDITSRKKDEELYVKTENLRVLGEMAAGIAHEIRNPLTSIKGFVKLLTDTVTDKKDQYYLNIMGDEIDRINDVVGELLYIAKPQAPIQKGQTIHMNKLLHDVKTLLDTTAVMTGVTIDLLMIDKINTQRVEERQIKQVLINIIKNALEAVEKNGRIRILLECSDQDQFRIRIIDNGSGISKETLKKLGEPFYTTKERGTGLGLTVCFKIIQENNGQIRIWSKQGLGTIVDITLPR